MLSLSSAQPEIWSAERRSTAANRVYRIGEYLEIIGLIDPVLFETALRRVVEPSSEWLMPVVDVSGEPDPYTAAYSWMAADVARPMDVNRRPLFSHALLKLSPDRYFWYQCCHRVVADGFGFAPLLRRMAEVYTSLAGERTDAPNPFSSLRGLVDGDSATRVSARFGRGRAPAEERAEFVPPRGIEEVLMAKIWAEVLGVDQVGREDNFFQLGGDSLLGARLVFRLREVFRREIPLRELFRCQTVGELAAALASSQRATGARAEPCQLPPPSFVRYRRPVSGGFVTVAPAAYRRG